MRRSLFDLVRDECGATSIEYALIAALVSVGCIAGLTQFSESMGVLYSIVDTIAGVIGGA